MIQWIKELFCSHNFIKESNCIWCTNCGKIQLLPCKHDWIEDSRYNMKLDGRIIGQRIVYKCKNCAKIKQTNIS